MSKLLLDQKKEILLDTLEILKIGEERSKFMECNLTQRNKLVIAYALHYSLLEIYFQALSLMYKEQKT
jgi:hypothetical protein